jgi:hypothetical protein
MEEVSEPEMSNWQAHVFTINGRYCESDSDMPELISNSDTSSSEVESLDTSYRNYDEHLNLMLYNNITRSFSGTIAEYHPVEGSTEVDMDRCTKDAYSLDKAMRYGANIPLPEESTSVNSVFAVYKSVKTDVKDIHTCDQEVTNHLFIDQSLDHLERTHA